ncbi:hypothetical protein [Aureispira anguillae]|uniref:Replication restart DNA helicase PriA n=1 Tax=Aureispira anguillae TaxID=2864201 RepID=A0A915YGC2_9BACT|nr:hypothetical protein [Aureispira anguillae]BDS12647.1 hypothetical protein AsAng_0033710 [Aureispira anguillae]
MDDSLYNDDFLENVLELPCPTCGSELSYSASKQQINCNHCGFVKPYDEANDLVEEQCLEKAIQSMSYFVPKAIHKKVVDCGSCGSRLMIEDDKVLIRCNFCGSEKVNESAMDKNLIQPQGIVPFKIDAKEAKQKFRDWIQEGWFKPNKLQHLAELGDVHGIYVPFWTYDTQTHTNWSGEAGYHYYETEFYTDSDGEEQTREVQKTRWEYKRGAIDHFFDDVLIVASKGLPHKVITPIYPFKLEEVVNYSPTLMVGWEAEIYSLDVSEGYQVAEKKMTEELRSRASDALGGDTQRNLSVNIQRWDQTFKHIILPVWICSYIYNDKTYQFAVNGQTGKIHGTKPTSWFKVLGLILLIVAIIAAIVWAVKTYS